MSHSPLVAPDTARRPPTVDLVVRADRAFVDGAFRPATVSIADGLVVAITDPAEAVADDVRVIDVPSDAVLLPGLVDSHVHVNEPGRTEWEGFFSATLAAAAGGVTTIVDMPLNALPPTTTPEALQLKRQAATGQSYVDVAFWGGAIPANLGSLETLHESGVVGFKAFLSPSGVEEFPELDAAQLERAMREIAVLDSTLIVHAEDPTLLASGGPLGRSYDSFLTSRPAASESAAIQTVIEAMRRTGARSHIVHLSDGRALPAIRAAKAEGLPLSVETCPHYLTLSAEEIPDGAAEFKCCPPIRERASRDMLWEGVLDGTIDAIVTDHSPSTLDLKQAGDGDFGLAWGGISGLQVGLSVVWTEAQSRGIPLERIVPLLTTGPAAVAGLAGRGELCVGSDAHLTVIAPEREVVVDARRLLHRNPISAYHGMRLVGTTLLTLLRGGVVFDAAVGGMGAASADRSAPQGRLIRQP